MFNIEKKVVEQGFIEIFKEAVSLIEKHPRPWPKLNQTCSCILDFGYTDLWVVKMVPLPSDLSDRPRPTSASPVLMTF